MSDIISSKSRGFTLVEVLISIALLTFLAVGILGMTTVTINSNSFIQHHTKAVQLAESGLEELRRVDYVDQLSAYNGVVDGFRLHPQLPRVQPLIHRGLRCRHQHPDGFGDLACQRDYLHSTGPDFTAGGAMNARIMGRRGFTLVEMMVSLGLMTLVIIALLTMVTTTQNTTLTEGRKLDMNQGARIIEQMTLRGFSQRRLRAVAGQHADVA